MWAFFWEEQNLSSQQLLGEQERSGEQASNQEREESKVVRADGPRDLWKQADVGCGEAGVWEREGLETGLGWGWKAG
jgi:hypothetical protein